VPARQGPTAIIAHTIKGKGMPSLEDTLAAHYTQLAPDMAAEALGSLEKRP